MKTRDIRRIGTEAIPNLNSLRHIGTYHKSTMPNWTLARLTCGAAPERAAQIGARGSVNRCRDATSALTARDPHPLSRKSTKSRVLAGTSPKTASNTDKSLVGLTITGLFEKADTNGHDDSCANILRLVIVFWQHSIVVYRGEYLGTPSDTDGKLVTRNPRM